MPAGGAFLPEFLKGIRDALGMLLSTTPGIGLCGCFPDAVDVLAKVAACKPDVVLITGDCVNSGSAAEYARFQALLRPLTMPVYVIPGNHDNREQLLAAFGGQGSTPLAGFA